MARNKRIRRTEKPQPPAPLAVVPDELPPEQEPPLDLPSALFDDLPDEVPGLDDLDQFNPEVRWREELTGDHRPTDEDLAAESTPEAQELVDRVPSEEILDEFRKAVREPEFDPAPLDPSPPSWENGERTPPVTALPTTNDAVNGLIAENARLTDALGLTEHIIDDAHAETARLRTELTEAHAENIRLSEQLIADSTALGTTIEGQLDQLQAKDSEILLLRHEKENLLQQFTSETNQLSIVMQQFAAMEESKISVENRLVDSELTRADLESQLDMLKLEVAEMSARQSDRKLWMLTIELNPSPEAGVPLTRPYVLAKTVSDAIERAVEAKIAKAEEITNVQEIKGIKLVI